jgi:class 3 adenylate cyclase
VCAQCNSRRYPRPVSGPYRKSLDDPDETVEVAGIVEDVIEIGDFTVGRVFHPAGWRWSKDMKPLVGGDWCAARHVGVVISGRFRVELKDGTTFEVGPNEVHDIPPGHDAYVLGDEPVVTIEWSGLRAWTGFQTGSKDRVLAGLVMTDIVGSTAEAVRVGDVVWRHHLAAHHESMRSQLDRFRGREIDTAGDGMLAVFDGAARALECAAAIRDLARRDEMQIRVGVHVGEVELAGPNVRGVAVHEVARITSAARPGEILVSEPTQAMAMGAGVSFEDRGTHELKGLPEPRRLFAYLGDRVARS